MTIAGTTADTIKDFMLGRKTDYSDTMIDNILQMALLNRYTFTRGKEDGLLSSLIQSFLPSTQFIDDMWLDIGEMLNDPDDSFRINNMRSIKNIPIGGKLYYWWIGRAADYKEKEAKKKSKTTGIQVGKRELSSSLKSEETKGIQVGKR